MVRIHLGAPNFIFLVLFKNITRDKYIQETDMTTFTKYSTLTFQLTVDLVPVSFLDALMTKADQMESESKTNGLYTFVDEHRTRRVWLDQNAADEWVQFVATEAALYDVVITDYLIGDNV